MFKLLSIFVLATLVADSIGQKVINPVYKPSSQEPWIIRPVYRPPPRQTTIRTARDTNQEPLWLYQDGNIPRAPSSADNGFLPSIIDDVKFNPDRRYARSIDFESSVEPSDRYKRNVHIPTFPNPRPSGPPNPFPRPLPPRWPTPIYAHH